MGIFDLFSMSNKKEKLSELLKNGAIILDVRPSEEYRGGHIQGSKNIPVNTIQSNIEEIRKYGKPIITCCASGMRGGVAATHLKSSGIESVNGGNWGSLQNIVKSI